MVKKIITGIRSGAEKAAQAIAAKLGIPTETPTGISFETTDPEPTSISYLDSRNFEHEQKRIDAGIVSSNGTLIFSRGTLTEKANYARERTLNLRHQLLGIDLNQVNGF